MFMLLLLPIITMITKHVYVIITAYYYYDYLNMFMLLLLPIITMIT